MMVVFLRCFFRVGWAVSPVGWCNAASWVSLGDFALPQCLPHKKWNLKSLIFCGQQLEGEEEKGRKCGRAENEKMPLFKSRMKENDSQETLAV